MNRLPIRVADKSDTNLTLVMVAWAPLLLPTNTIPLSTQPLNKPCGSFESENVSIFNNVDVDEYVADNTWLVYGFSGNIFVGES